jgi:hypothetical protein
VLNHLHLNFPTHHLQLLVPELLLLLALPLPPPLLLLRELLSLYELE